jgi:hypothetical protein
MVTAVLVNLLELNAPFHLQYHTVGVGVSKLCFHHPLLILKLLKLGNTVSRQAKVMCTRDPMSVEHLLCVTLLCTNSGHKQNYCIGEETGWEYP